MKIIFLLLLISTITANNYDWTNLTDTINSYLANVAFTGGILRVANGTHTIYSQPFGYFTHTNLPFSAPPFTN